MNYFAIILLIVSQSIAVNIAVAQTKGDTILPKADNQLDNKGLKQGFWRKYHNNGQVRYEGYFIDDKPCKLFKYYYESGKPKATLIYYNDNRSAAAHLYYEKDSTLMAVGLYYQSKKDSLWKYYSGRGVLVADEFYRRGKKHGISSTYFPNGNVSEQIGWKEGIKDGVWKQYFEDGTLKIEGDYVNGRLEGDIKYYDPYGKLTHEGRYVHSLRDSTWVFYKDNGEVKLKKIYDNGELLNRDELEDFILIKEDDKIIKE